MAEDITYIVMCSRDKNAARSHYRVDDSLGPDDKGEVRVTHGADSFLPGFDTFVKADDLVPCGCGRWREATDAEYAHTLKVFDLAEEVTKEEARALAEVAAEGWRRGYEDATLRKADDAAVKRSYDDAYQREYARRYGFPLNSVRRLCNAYERQPHPASVSATGLAAEVLQAADPQHKLDTVDTARMLDLLAVLAEKVLQAFKPN